MQPASVGTFLFLPPAMHPGTSMKLWEGDWRRGLITCDINLCILKSFFLKIDTFVYIWSYMFFHRYACMQAYPLIGIDSQENSCCLYVQKVRYIHYIQSRDRRHVHSAWSLHYPPMFPDFNWYSIYLMNTPHTPVFFVLDQQVVTGRSGMFWRSLACFASRHFIRYLTSWASQSVSIRCVPYLSLDPRHTKEISTAIGSLGKLKTFEIAAKNTFLFHLLQDLIHCCEIASRIYIPLPEEAARQRMLEHFLKDRIRKAVGKAVSDVWCVNRFYGFICSLISGCCHFHPFHVSITLSQNEVSNQHLLCDDRILVPPF